MSPSQPSPRSALPAVGSFALVLGLALASTTSAGADDTSPAPPSVIPPEAARVVGEPVVFRLTTTQESGVAFIAVARMTKRLTLMNASINGYGADGEQAPLLTRRSGTCYATKYSGFGRRRNGRIVWSIPAAVANLDAGDSARVMVLDTSDDNWYDVSRPLPAEAFYQVRIRSPRGPIRTLTGQYSLRNRLAQRRLRAIGCSGRIRKGVLQY